MIPEGSVEVEVGGLTMRKAFLAGGGGAGGGGKKEKERREMGVMQSKFDGLSKGGGQGGDESEWSGFGGV